MRISDWSSDVCSSDLSARTPRRRTQGARPGPAPFFAPAMRPARPSPLHQLPLSHDPRTDHRLPAARRPPMLALPAPTPACAPPALAAEPTTAADTNLATYQVNAPRPKEQPQCTEKVK